MSSVNSAVNSARPLTPPPSPLAMPTQVLSQPPNTPIVSQDPSIWLARLLTFGGSFALTVVASQQMYLSLPFSEVANASSPAGPWITGQLWLLLSVFTLTFSWVSLSATTSVAGILVDHKRYSSPGQTDAALQGKTVLVMPIYNEDAASACAALAAMGEDLERLGLLNQERQHKSLKQHFEIFILSDTNAPEIVPTEMAAVQCLREHLSGIMPVWYRRREQNTERKAGNIRDFVRRWGDAYDYMVVLDADSLITAATLATLVREMDADPSTGIVQTLPRLCGGETLFARLQQFSGVAYGFVFARGLSAWQGHDGNYWGHNAIIRIRAFAASAGLPTMRGHLPFGGDIRSHDFVEAALIRRAGWAVRMLPELDGTWEECPPTLLDASIRDRRWAQGNVQHLAVVAARGLRWPSRAHLLMGVMNYLTSLLWLAMVTLGLTLSAQLALLQEQVPSGEIPPMFDAGRTIGLFIFSITLLLLPKMIGLASGLLSRERRAGAGRLKFILSAILELIFSVLHTPVLMLIHSRHLWEIARGQDSGWSTQRRRGDELKWQSLLARHGLHTALGLLVTTLLLILSPSLLYWLLPIVLGLVLAVPLVALSSSRTVGQWLAQRGLLSIPEEMASPEIMKRRQVFLDSFTAAIIAGQQHIQSDDKHLADIKPPNKCPEPAGY